MSARAAPPVSVRCSGGLRWQLLRAFLPAMAVWAVGTWLLQRAHQSLLWGCLALVVVAGCGAWLARPQPRCLSFNGECWDLDGAFCAVDVMCDAFGLILLRLRAHPPARKVLWLACTETEAGAALHGLRVALYAHQTDHQTDGQAQAARPDLPAFE
jgi:hypothetical protein